jgi:predicted alpha/beta-fold hydrolase
MANSSTASQRADTLSTGRSAPRAFKDFFIDYQFSRFLGLATYNGAEIGECFQTAHLIEEGNNESWITEWTKTARHVEGLAEKSLAGGHKISAREAFLRATTYYQAAFFLILDRDPRKAELYRKHIQCFDAAGALFDPPFESVRIPYEGKKLVGYFLKCDDKPRPTVLIQMGADGSCGQMYFSGGGAAALRRGYNALIFEGPGQTGTYMEDHSLVYRHDWEVPVRAVVDYALTRPEVDPARIALVAYSMGGYYGPRAAAFEKRLAACVASGLMPDVAEIARSRTEGLARGKATGQFNDQQKYLLHEHMPKYGFNKGIEDLPKLEAIFRKMNLNGLEDKITCPFLNLQAASEGEAMNIMAREFFDKLPNPKNKYVITTEDDGADMHCQKGNASYLHALVFDWLEEVMD